MWNNDKELFSYLMRIAASVFLSLAWFMACLSAGIFLELGHTQSGTKLIFVILFYLGVAISGIVLFLYIKKLWKK
ncbi:MAG TPA: hypothetical protein PK695_01300 [Chitinophagaceae bacterium]|jgi:hypothetical protein|nr:hypothetical protein [Chitinophagaceae bacterium]OPZ18840.1 MAG: hypothetical protein BWZ05_00515 [Bacteroidetes bacterium ADurb.BinA245]HMW67033.1 hypothetical protein [Chitinophagaceae bacterium]HMX78068.1 hypothetical protein [Chitinophagaceae bacterium]HNA18872.1 hypothetical protein [Chitinophagaceae bacterium]